MNSSIGITLATCIAVSACVSGPKRLGVIKPLPPITSDSKCMVDGDQNAPAGFAVRPVEAIESLPIKHAICKGKVEVPLYADETNYYFFRSVTGIFSPSAEEVREHSFIVDGRSGVFVTYPKGLQ